jgi:ribose 1,5-bisphosphokinase PhnN
MTTEPAPPTYAQQAIGIVVPATCRHFVAVMRAMEEIDMSADARWALLRQRLEQLGRENTEAS